MDELGKIMMIVVILAFVCGCIYWLRHKIQQAEEENNKETAKLLPPEEEVEPTSIAVWYEGDTTAKIYDNVDNWDVDGKWLIIWTGGEKDNRIHIDTQHKKFLRFHVFNN